MPAMARRKPWPATELDALVALQDKTRRVMPILHGLTYEELKTHSPVLASRLGVRSDEGLEAVLAKIQHALS